MCLVENSTGKYTYMCYYQSNSVFFLYIYIYNIYYILYKKHVYIYTEFLR